MSCTGCNTSILGKNVTGRSIPGSDIRNGNVKLSNSFNFVMKPIMSIGTLDASIMYDRTNSYFPMTGASSDLFNHSFKMLVDVVDTTQNYTIGFGTRYKGNVLLWGYVEDVPPNSQVIMEWQDAPPTIGEVFEMLNDGNPVTPPITEQYSWITGIVDLQQSTIGITDEWETEFYIKGGFDPIYIAIAAIGVVGIGAIAYSILSNKKTKKAPTPQYW